MEKEAVLEAGRLEEPRLELAGQLGRVADDALRVLGGAEVLCGEGAGERADRLLVGDLDQLPLAALELEEAAEVVGVQEQLLLGPLVGHQPERPLEEAAGELLDERQKI